MPSIARDTTGNVELPPELWERILREEYEQAPTWKARDELKGRSLVCRLFKRLCQEALFKELSLTSNVRMDYKNHAFDLEKSLSPARRPFSRYFEPKKWPVQELNWEEWERDMRSAIRSERRLVLIGGHNFLAAQPRCCIVRGYEYRDCYPRDPFARPSERQALSRAVSDVRQRFGRTLLNQLPSLANLRRVEFSNYAVEADLLSALELHQPLTELSFVFCWFPESTSALASITSLSFGQIPGSHIRPHTSHLGYEPYTGVPDHHVTSAFNLISPSHLESLDITFGCENSSPGRMLGQLCAWTATEGEFLRLHSMNWYFPSRCYPPSASSILKFLGRTPALRELSIQGYLPSIPRDVLATAGYTSLVETLSCPLDWARLLVPGRPIKSLKLCLPDTLQKPDFLAHTEGEIEDTLRPLTLSTAPITTFHLPYYPPVAPLRLLMPYLTTEFPSVRDLRMAVAGETVGTTSYGFMYGTEGNPPIPKADAGEHVVEDGLLEVLEGDLKDDVEARLATCPDNHNHLPALPPVLDRVMAFRGIEPDGHATTAPSTSSITGHFLPVSASRSPTPSSPATSEDAAQQEDLLTPLIEYFGELDSHPRHEPETALDLLYFISRGYYTLPRFVENLTLFSCFEVESAAHRSRIAWPIPQSDRRPTYVVVEEEEAYRRCTQTVLMDISRRYTELSAFHDSDSIFDYRRRGDSRGRFYHKLHDQREGGGAWVSMSGSPDSLTPILP